MFFWCDKYLVLFTEKLFLGSDIFFNSAFWVFTAEAGSKALFSPRNPFSELTSCQTDLINSASNHVGIISVSPLRTGEVI